MSYWSRSQDSRWPFAGDTLTVVLSRNQPLSMVGRVKLALEYHPDGPRIPTDLRSRLLSSSEYTARFFAPEKRASG